MQKSSYLTPVGTAGWGNSVSAQDHPGYGIAADALSLQRLIAWVDACCPFMGEEEVCASGDPDFVGIEELPVRPRVKTAPVVERP